MRGRGGAIVNISSVHAVVSYVGNAVYDASKAGIIGLTRALALEYGPEKIRANAICPGYINTPMMDEWLAIQPDADAALKQVLSFHPLGRVGTPRDVADAALFLASDAVALLGERMTLVRWGSLLLALVGVLIVSEPDCCHANLHSMKFLGGNLIILLAITGSAFYNVYSKRLLGRFTPLEVLVFGYLVAAGLYIPLVAGMEPSALGATRSYTAGVWVSLVVLSVLSWGLAMILWMYLLRRLDVSQASVSIYLLPLLGVLFSAVLLKERITAAMIAGGLLTLAGTILITTADTEGLEEGK